MTVGVMVSVSVLAERYGTSKDFWRKQAAQGHLPGAVKIGVRKPGVARDMRPLRIPLAEAEALLERVQP